MGVYLCTCLCAFVWMNECVRLCVCACVWMKAPGQAIRYWCSRLRVRRGKWMCACVLECACACLCVCTGGHVVSSNSGWWKMASADMISHLLIKMYCCRLVAVSLFEFSVNSLSILSLSLFLSHSASFFLCLPCLLIFCLFLVSFTLLSLFFFSVQLAVIKK